MIQAILFDYNGVIVDDEQIHLRAYRDVLRTEGVALSDEDYLASLGMDDVAFVRAAFARNGRSLTDEMLHAVIRREHDLHRDFIKEELPAASGVITFIKEASRYYQLGIVSMAVRGEIDYLLERAALDGLFVVLVTAEQVTKHKPAPDCYQLALSMLNHKLRAERKLPLLADEFLVIEDSPPGIEAARAAGMRTIGVTNTVSEAELRKAGADVVTANLGDWNVDAVHRLFD